MDISYRLEEARIDASLGDRSNMNQSQPPYGRMRLRPVDRVDGVAGLNLF